MKFLRNIKWLGGIDAMSQIKTKFSDLTKEQKLQVKKIGRKFVFKNMLTGANYGGLFFFSNLALIFANETFFDSTTLLIVLCVVVDVILINMMLSSMRENAIFVRDEVKKIVDAK